MTSKEPVCKINGGTNNFKSLTDEGGYSKIQQSDSAPYRNVSPISIG